MTPGFKLKLGPTNYVHNDVKISAFPEGQYFGPNYFHNSNEKSENPSIATLH